MALQATRICNIKYRSMIPVIVFSFKADWITTGIIWNICTCRQILVKIPNIGWEMSRYVYIVISMIIGCV